MQVFEDRLGRATASIISIMDPQRIILAGTLPYLDRFADRVPRKWPGYVQIDRSNTNLAVLDDGMNTVLIGAACPHSMTVRASLTPESSVQLQVLASTSSASVRRALILKSP